MSDMFELNSKQEAQMNARGKHVSSLFGAVEWSSCQQLAIRIYIHANSRTQNFPRDALKCVCVCFLQGATVAK